jgi:lysophospholipase L1-like esterase
VTPVLYQTWGRRDGEPGKENDDFYQMNERVRRGYAAASERGGGIAIAPAGDAWEEVFNEGRGSELYVEDGSHPSAYGNKVTAKSIFETLFKSSENASG